MPLSSKMRRSFDSTMAWWMLYSPTARKRLMALCTI